MINLNSKGGNLSLQAPAGRHLSIGGLLEEETRDINSFLLSLAPSVSDLVSSPFACIEVYLFISHFFALSLRAENRTNKNADDA